MFFSAMCREKYVINRNIRNMKNMRNMRNMKNMKNTPRPMFLSRLINGDIADISLGDFRL